MANYKVVDTDKLDTDLQTVANAIKAKAGIEAAIKFPNGFISAVESIETGGETPTQFTNLVNSPDTIIKYDYRPTSTGYVATEQVVSIAIKVPVGEEAKVRFRGCMYAPFLSPANSNVYCADTVTADGFTSYTTLEKTVSLDECGDLMLTVPNPRKGYIIFGVGEIYGSYKETVPQTLPIEIITLNEPIGIGMMNTYYTNLLDEAGYVENTYLSSGKAQTRSGVECTGYMPLDGSDKYVIYLSGITANLSTNNFRVAFYGDEDEDTILMQLHNTQIETNSYAPVSYETDKNGNIVKLDCTVFLTTYLASINGAAPSYFRLCSDNIDENSIITINEPVGNGGYVG